MVRDVISKFLKEEGYRVTVTSNGNEAIKLLRLDDINLVITDLRMPGIDGMEVLRTTIQINPQIAVVLVTAYGTLDIVLEAMKEGAYDYLVKPFVMQQLLLVVRNAFRMSSLMEENRELSNQLKETYRSLEHAKEMISIKNDNIKQDSIGTAAKSIGEADGNSEKVENPAIESLKKYSSIIKNLKDK